MLLLATTSAACAGSQHPDDQLTVQSPEERIFELRSVHRELSEHPEAKLVARDLDLASSWLERASQLSADPKHDPARLTLFIQAAEGQLIQIQTFYASKTASSRLEGVRSNYEQRMKNIEAQRQTNDRSLAKPSRKEARP
jgi:hypothetical protein